MKSPWHLSLSLPVLVSILSAAPAPDGWTTAAPRVEIRPEFSYQVNGGRDGTDAFVIVSDQRDGLQGHWRKSFPIEPGQYYHVSVFQRTENVPLPRRSAFVRLLWQNDGGRPVAIDEPVVSEYLVGPAGNAEPEYPLAGQADAAGWTEFAGTYRAPAKATRAVVELHLQWAPNGRAAWSNVALVKTTAPAARKVRLAAAHFRPSGGTTAMDNCRQFAPVIARAAEQHADLIVLPEMLTFCGRRVSMIDAAEPIPGPSTNYFGELAKEHGLYIVAGLIERAGHLVYNTAVLLAPDGRLAGKYRKVALPRTEIEAGIAPGKDYPVFTTRFGALGIMICYDGMFPEVARELSTRGAEVIAWPVWGSNPDAARARAFDNHVYVVTSTYAEPAKNWMRTGVFDHAGALIATTAEWGNIAIAEVDLARPTKWVSMGDFKAQLPRHRPESPGETTLHQ